VPEAESLPEGDAALVHVTSAWAGAAKAAAVAATPAAMAYERRERAAIP
jgi:hypothetical protein